MAQERRIKFWTLLIPLAIGIIFVALDIWPGKAVRSYRLETKRSNRELVGAFGEDDWEWVERGKGYQSRKGEMVRHGRWIETCRDQFSGTWRCEGAYKKGYRDGKWTVFRNDEFFREYILKKGKKIKTSRERSTD